VFNIVDKPKLKNMIKAWFGEVTRFYEHPCSPAKRDLYFIPTNCRVSTVTPDLISLPRHLGSRGHPVYVSGFRLQFIPPLMRGRNDGVRLIVRPSITDLQTSISSP